MRTLKALVAWIAGIAMFIVAVAVWKLGGVLFPLIVGLGTIFSFMVLFFAPMGRRNDDGSPDDPE